MAMFVVAVFKGTGGTGVAVGAGVAVGGGGVAIGRGVGEGGGVAVSAGVGDGGCSTSEPHAVSIINRIGRKTIRVIRIGL